jgi:hypothetical protein
MEDTLSKYLRLFGNILLTFIIFLVFLFGLLLMLKLAFGLLDHISWFSYLYTVFILLLPVVLFSSVYFIFFKRTKYHPSKAVRGVSYFIFSAAILSWLVFLAMDIKTYSIRQYAEIGKYISYDTIYLTANVAVIFLVGIIQALTTAKEKDWMEKHLH